MSFKQIASGVGVAVVALFILILCISGCSTIGPGNVGIVISKVGAARGVQDVTVKTGWVIVNPITTEVIEYPTYMQTVKWTKSADEGKAVDESITFTTNTGTSVNADVSLSYQLDYDKAPNFYVKFRADDIQKFTDGFLRNVTRDAFDEVAGQHTVEEVMGDNGPILKAVRKSVQEQLSPYGITISQLGFIGAPRPPQSVTDSINSKVNAQQLGLQKQNELVQATADGQKLVARRTAEAQAEVIAATADATANKLRSESLTPQILERLKIDKWDGHLPQVQGGATPMINLGEK
jgi:regulator of protease activity HflC (stomatin/prohibitin superfamily)